MASLTLLDVTHVSQQRGPDRSESPFLYDGDSIDSTHNTKLTMFLKSPAFAAYWDALSEADQTNLLAIAVVYGKLFEEDRAFFTEKGPEFFRLDLYVLIQTFEIMRHIRPPNSPESIEYFLGSWMIFSLKFSGQDSFSFFEEVRTELVLENNHFQRQELSEKMHFWFSHKKLPKEKYYGEISDETWEKFSRGVFCDEMFFKLIGLLEIIQEALDDKLHKELFCFYRDLAGQEDRDRKLFFSLPAKENFYTPHDTRVMIREKMFTRSDEIDEWLQKLQVFDVDGFLEKVDMFGVQNVFPLMMPREIALFLYFCMRQAQYKHAKFYLRLSASSVIHLNKDLNREGSVDEIEKFVLEKYFRREEEKDQGIWEERSEATSQKPLA